MQRISPIQRDANNEETTQLLDMVEKKMGMVPNIIATMANSIPATNAYLAMSQSLASGSLSARLREKISLTVGQANQCDYCVAAHSAIGQNLGMSESEVHDARLGQAEDEKQQAALTFSQKLVNQRGMVSDEDVTKVREAGYNHAEIVELVANVALNLFTNYFNHVANTEVDFPAVKDLATA